MIRIIIFAIVVFLASCHTKDKVEKGKENWVEGTVQSIEGIDTVFFHDCYCNLVDEEIVLNHVYFGGMHGGHLTTRRKKDSIQFDLSYYPYDFRTFSYNRKELKMDQPHPKPGETITGLLALEGESRSRKSEVYKFALKGRFKCTLHDSTYDYMAFYSDFLDRYDSIEMVKLGEVALNNPDSVVELQLKHKNFHIVKDKLHLFKNLQRLSLSKFNSIDTTFLSGLKSLKELRIDGDSLTKVPRTIVELKDLELLSITGPITSVPEGLYTLTKLKELDLAATHISELSPQIKNLNNLENLNIGYTKITRVPREIFELKKLTDLTLPDSLIPFKINKLNFESIKTLHVSYDFLMYNKESIGKLQNLEWLYPSFVYSSHDEYMKNYSNQIKWLEDRLPNVHISGTSYVNDNEQKVTQ